MSFCSNLLKLTDALLLCLSFSLLPLQAALVINCRVCWAEDAGKTPGFKPVCLWDTVHMPVLLQSGKHTGTNPSRTQCFQWQLSLLWWQVPQTLKQKCVDTNFTFTRSLQFGFKCAAALNVWHQIFLLSLWAASLSAEMSLMERVIKKTTSLFSSN